MTTPDPTRSKAIEVMAEAIAEADTAYATMTDIAEAALDALQAEGMTVVPVEPTEAMVIAGGGSIIRPDVFMGGVPTGAKRRARDVWAAMLSASPSMKAR